MERDHQESLKFLEIGQCYWQSASELPHLEIIRNSERQVSMGQYLYPVPNNALKTGSGSYEWQYLSDGIYIYIYSTDTYAYTVGRLGMKVRLGMRLDSSSGSSLVQISITFIHIIVLMPKRIASYPVVLMSANKLLLSRGNSSLVGRVIRSRHLLRMTSQVNITWARS